MKVPAAGQRGFTLVEVMVALTILSLVMLVTVTGLRTLANTQVAIERVTARVDEVRTISSFLRDSFDSIVIGTSTGGLSLGGHGGGSTVFQVLPHAVEWQSIVLFGESYGGSYILRLEKEGDALMLRWHEPPTGRRGLDWSTAPSRQVVTGLEELDISYKRKEDGPWQNTWDSEGVPSLLSLQLKASGRYWPQLVFRLQ